MCIAWKEKERSQVYNFVIVIMPHCLFTEDKTINNAIHNITISVLTLHSFIHSNMLWMVFYTHFPPKCTRHVAAKSNSNIIIIYKETTDYMTPHHR